MSTAWFTSSFFSGDGTTTKELVRRACKGLRCGMRSRHGGNMTIRDFATQQEHKNRKRSCKKKED